MRIESNGSKWAGESPDPIKTLLEVLERETLDPTFEKFGKFFYRLPTGEFRAFGNFLTVSHVFSITGSLEELRPLATALKRARQKRSYLVARSYLNPFSLYVRMVHHNHLHG